MRLKQKEKRNWLVVLSITITIVVIEIATSFNSVLLPNLREEFAISEQLTQWTISIALLALCISGLFYGVISDSIGRRPVLLSGLGLFCISSLGAALAPNITWLLIARFLQGFGAGVGWIVGNACLKDLYDPKKYIKVMNQVHAMVGIIPAFAPAVGSYLGTLIGWRACFGLIFIFSSITLLTKVRHLPETLQHPQKLSLQHSKLIYVRLFLNHEYLTYLFIKASAVMLLFIEISNIPLIYIEHLNVPSAYYGAFMLPAFFMYILTTYVSGRISHKVNVNTLILIGFIFILFSNLSIIIFSLFMDLSAIEIQAFKLFTYMGWGLIFGNATGCVISSAANSTGAASSTMIASEMLFSSIGIYISGLFFNGTVVPVSLFMVCVSILCVSILVVRIRSISS